MANNSNQHHDTRPDGRLSRRDFVKAAVAIGGSSALSACLDREASQGPADTETSIEHEDGDLSVPRPADHGDRPDALHRWNDYLVTDASGNTVLPRHQVVLGLNYVGSTPPTDSERNVVNRAFDMLDRAFRWGTGDSDSAGVSDGLLWMLGYSAEYFRQLGMTVPERLIAPDALVSAVGEQPSTADRFDAALVLTGDFGSIPLAAENALWGERELLNGVTVDATLDGIFDRAVRRTGLTGKGVVAAELESDEVPENAPLSMGFRSGFQDNQPTEDAVTINEGPFAGGTTLAVSRLHIDINRWYGQSTEERAAEMFCPAHDASEIGDTAESLGNSSRISPADVEKIPTHAAEYDRIGHSQKLATARDNEFRPRILRRSEGVATDVPEGAGFNFTSIQSDIEEFVAVRRAMNVDDYDVDVAPDNHGIIDYLETRGRTALVVPTRDDVGLPAP